IFGTLLSSQGTVASFVLTLSGFPPGASLRCFRLYQILSVSDSLSAGCLRGFRLSPSALSTFTTLAHSLGDS
ncbi:hypothetical protein AV521_30215, partial [Streptomyces sp. IMTB 2501]